MSCRVVFAIVCAILAVTPVHAQFFDNRFPFMQGWPGQQGPWGGPFEPPPRQRVAPPIDYSKAPAPKRTEKPAEKTVLVIGDSLADWLGYGLEEALSDSSEFGIVRKIRAATGLIDGARRRAGYDWVVEARKIVAENPAIAIVIMLGGSDVKSIREEAPASADRKSQERDATRERDAPREQIHEFRSPRWSELYTQRIEQFIGSLKAKNVPIVWVGLPLTRGARSADLQHLNELYRTISERSGVEFVDIWDGFADDNGRLVTFGPDAQGQQRRLRAADGVHFTKPGALKLAHYAERALMRSLKDRAPEIALPAAPEPEIRTRKDPETTIRERPLAGPVIQLNVVRGETDGLLGGPSPQDQRAQDQSVRIPGELGVRQTIQGRADDFQWPRPVAAETTIVDPRSTTGQVDRLAPAPRQQNKSKAPAIADRKK